MHQVKPGGAILMYIQQEKGDDTVFSSAIAGACEVATEPYKDHACPFVSTTDERRDLPLPGERPAGGGIYGTSSTGNSLLNVTVIHFNIARLRIAEAIFMHF